MFVGVASLSQPFLENCLILLLDPSEHHSHAVSVNVHYLALGGEDGATVNDTEVNLCTGGQNFLRGYLAAENAEVSGLLADLDF
jgi:hypothetical protein